MMADVRTKFGLDDYIAEQLSHYEMFLPLLKRVFDYTTKEGIAILLKSMGKKYLGKNVAKYVPIIGQGVAVAAGYGMMRYIVNAYVDDCYELATKVKSLSRKNRTLEEIEDLSW